MAGSKSGTRTKEIRAGLVLYGGVSLAVYIYGVVLEFLRAVRARDERPEDNPYAGIVRDTGNHLTVDIISGASAGGINGVWLAKAICNGNSTSSFKAVRDFWVEKGDMSLLLQPGRPEMAALLDEGYFEEEGLKALNKMDADSKASG